MSVPNLIGARTKGKHQKKSVDVVVVVVVVVVVAAAAAAATAIVGVVMVNEKPLKTCKLGIQWKD